MTYQLLWLAQFVFASLATLHRARPRRRRFSLASSVEALHAALTDADLEIETLTDLLTAERERAEYNLKLALDSAQITEGYKLACVFGNVSPALLQKYVPHLGEHDVAAPR